MGEAIGRRAVVVGAGMGGLAAARAVAPFFDRVVVLDRDALPEGAAPRIGAPQSRHVHALLQSGAQALETLFPGIGGDFVKAGGTRARNGLDLLVEWPGYDPFPRRDLGSELIFLSRPGLERVCRRRLEDDPRVEIRARTRVVEFIPSPDGVGVWAVRTEDADGTVREIAADLVIDASGRAVPTLALLERVGLPKPSQSEVGVDVGYASAIVEPSNEARDWLAVAHHGTPPDQGRGGFIAPIEDGRWIVSIGRCPGGDMPADIDGLVAFTKTLRTRTLHDAIRTAHPVTGVARYGLPASVRRHFHAIEPWPRGLVPLGDTICRFNPLFGQGMSVAAMEAVALGRLLRARAGAADPLAGLGHDFLVGVQDLLDAPWSVALSDFAYAHTTGDRPPDLARRLHYSQGLVRLAAEDADVHRLMVEVAHLLKPPAALREPSIRDRVMGLMQAA